MRSLAGQLIFGALCLSTLCAAGVGEVPAPGPKNITKPGAVNRQTPAPSSSKLKGRIEKSVRSGQDWQVSYREGDVLYSNGKYKEAYTVWAETLKIVEKNESWKELSAQRDVSRLKQLATMYKTQSRPADAITMYDLAIGAACKNHGKESPSVAGLMLEQGRMYTFYDQVKNTAKADELLTEAFRIHEQVFGRFTIPTGDVAIALAQLKEEQKKYKQALAYWQLAIDIGDKLEPNIVSCCRVGPRQGKARCLEELSQYDRALDAHKDLLTMCQKGAKDMMPTVMNTYAACLRKAGRQAEANAILNRRGS